VPGVGAFKKAMENLENLNLIKPIVEFIEKGKPFLGICLGLQLLFAGSEEFGWQRGLSIFRGRVVRFRENSLKIPHMGWNTIRIKKPAPIFEGLADGAYFYFVHSYYPVPEDEEIVAATTRYGLEFTSAIAFGNLFALQFHPEKSQTVGLQIIKNFGHLVYP
jgi:glutamine amidotransferase